MTEFLKEKELPWAIAKAMAACGNGCIVFAERRDGFESPKRNKTNEMSRTLHCLSCNEMSTVFVPYGCLTVER